MDLNQQGDWSRVHHVSLLLSEPNVRHVEYFWSHVVDIEKAMPATVVLTNSGGDGLYRIPLTKVQCRAGNWLIIGVSYTDNRVEYGLLTAKHFTDTYTNPNGHPVTRVSMLLARPPFAWVKPHVPSHIGICQFTGDDMDGHRPDLLVSKVYSSVDAQFRNMLFHVTTLDKDVYIEAIVRDALSRLSAPLAFKALYEQSRLTQERLRLNTGHSDPGDLLWGTTVLWTMCDEPTESTLIAFDRESRPQCVQSGAGWLEVTLTCEGVLTKRAKRNRVTREFITVPYWAVILTALCCGALDVWRGSLCKMLAALKVDLVQLPTDTKASCQRCGFNYRTAPRFCPSDPLRVLAVRQIDKILFGDLCTTLCAKVFPVCSLDHAKGQAANRARCLNHKRPYSVSSEEDWEDRHDSQDEDQQQATVRREIRESAIRPQDQTSGSCDSTSAHQLRYKDRRERSRQDSSQARSTTNEPDPGWWMWQKQCRDRRRGKIGGVQSRKRRLWELYAEKWGTAEESDGKSTSVRHWREFSCQSRGYHVKTFPFGHYGGPLTV